MTNSQLTIRVLLEGAIGAFVLIVIAFLLSRFTHDIFGRSVLVIFLFIAAGAYFGFAVMARDLWGTKPFWMLIEVIQVVIFGAMALLGLRGSAWWLVAGWALHPLWDAGLHYLGPGRSFAPVTYAIACISFDLLVAAYITVAYGLIGSRRLGFRETAT
jgi:hypothetical protein